MTECKRLSFTFSDTSVSTPSPAPSTHSHAQSNPEITVTPPEMDLLPSHFFPPREDSIAEEHLVEEDEEEYEEDGESTSRGSRRTSGSLASDEAEAADDSEWERTESQRNSGSHCGSAAASLCLESHLSTVAPEDVFLDQADELKPVELDTEEPGSLTRQLVKRLTSSEIEPPAVSSAEAGEVGLSWTGEGSRAFLESGLEEAIHSLLMRLEALTHRCRELQDLEQEVMRFEDLLKVSNAGASSDFDCFFENVNLSPSSLKKICSSFSWLSMMMTRLAALKRVQLKFQFAPPKSDLGNCSRRLMKYSVD